MKAVCSSSDFKAKFIDDAKRTARRPPSFRTIIPSRTSRTGTKSCVDFLLASAWGIGIVYSLQFTVDRKFVGLYFCIVLLSVNCQLFTLVFILALCDALFYVQAPREIM